MRKDWLQMLLCLITFMGYGCISDENRRIRQLAEEMDICLPNDTDSCFLIIIPGNGCGNCIQEAVTHIRDTKDTVYVFMCDTEKDFFLLSGGKKAAEFSNLYVDKNNVSVKLKMVDTFPMVYFLKNGKYAGHWPYKREVPADRRPLTVLSVNRLCLDWGKFDWTEKQEDKVTLTNTGTETLYINTIESSCECTTVEWMNAPIPPGKQAVLKIHFQAEETGEFERLIHIYCNIPESPIEISVKENAK